MILVVAETANGRLTAITAQMVTAARGLTRDGGVTIFVPGSGIAAAAEQATQLADQVLVADLPALAHYNSELWTAAVTQIATQGEAHTILISATRNGRDCSPRIAVKLGAALLEDVVTLTGDAQTIRADRFTYLGRVRSSVETHAPIVVATIKPGSFEAAVPLAAPGEQYDVDLELPASRLTITARNEERNTRVALADADIVVAGGRGLGSAETFERLITPLAASMNAAIAATRAVVDAGWRPYAEQVGQTGKSVQPKLYIAVGISGAVQHLSGMAKSRTIVALNKDADAPIFTEADYGIIGDVQQTVPALIAELNRST